MFQPITNAGATCSGTPLSCSQQNAQLGTPPSTPGGSGGTPKFYYSPGDLHLSGNGSLGYGILVVDGDVEFNGGIYFEGIIIARGTAGTGGGADAVILAAQSFAGQSVSDTTTDVSGNIDVSTIPAPSPTSYANADRLTFRTGRCIDPAQNAFDVLCKSPCFAKGRHAGIRWP
jgi:hypothetical protein